MFKLKYTQTSLDDLSILRKRDQSIILDAIVKQLSYEPIIPSNDRKKLRKNVLSEWELRVRKFRIFYDVDCENNAVEIKTIGWKVHGRLFIQGKVFVL